MRRSIHLLAFALASLAAASQQAFHPDYHGDTIPRQPIRENLGQMIDTDGQLRPDVFGYTESSPLNLFLREKSEISFVLRDLTPDTSGVDSLLRIDMKMVAEASMVDPVFYGDAGGYCNYYLPHTMPNGVTGADGFARAIYEGIYPNIDMHVYSTSSGYKLAWVIWPGGDPNNIWMQFNGQDSVHIDWAGFLRLYANGQFLRLDTAVAYQYHDSTLLYIPSGAEYMQVGTDDLIKFSVDTYNDTLPLVLQVGAPPLLGGGSGGLCWSTYFGGDDGDYVQASTVDDDGNYLVTGGTESTYTTFPYFLGWNSGSLGNATFVTKFTDEHELLWTNYHAGAGEDQGNAIITKSPNEIYVTGYSSAADWPTQPAIGAYYDGVASVSGTKVIM